MKTHSLFLLIFMILVTACAPQSAATLAPMPAFTKTPLATITLDPTQTLEPTPVPTNTVAPTPTASATSTPFIGQVTIEHAQIVYYDITGSTENELRKSMDMLRPKDPFWDFRPVDAYTAWHISWNWPGYGTDTCDLTAAVISYEIKVTIPRWTPPANASPNLIAKWEKYIQILELHEKGHVNNVVNNFPNVQTAIRNATCATADVAGSKALLEISRLDSTYDNETQHGATQGAIFP